MGYAAFARGALLNKRATTETVIVDCGVDGKVLVVLAAPPENLALELFEEAEGTGTRGQVEMAAKLIIAMAHAPKEDPDGAPINLGTEDDPVCLPGEKMFTMETNFQEILELPVGNPMASLRDFAATFAGTLAAGKKSTEEADDGGTTASPNSSEELTKKTSEDGAQSELATG